MSQRQRRPHGLWESPVQPHHLSAAVRFRDLAWDSDGGTLVWLEGRGADNVVVCQSAPDQAPRDLTAGAAVRARVGYGGGEFAVSRGRLFYTAAPDPAGAGGRLCVQNLAGGPARPITPAFGSPASPAVSPDGRWVAYVHSSEGEDRLALVDAGGRQWPQVLASGADFYMQPAWHPRGRLLAWVEWDHPQMPWDGTRLVVARLQARGGALALVERTTVAGGPDTAVAQPAFTPDGAGLVYVSDRDGWSNLWRYDLERRQDRCLCAEEAEAGIPTWVQGIRVYTISADGQRLYYGRSSGGVRQAWCLDLASGRSAPVPELADLVGVSQPAAAPRGRALALVGGWSRSSARVLSLHRGRLCAHARATGETLDPEALSEPRSVTWAAPDGTPVHGLYWPPASLADEGTGRPPLVVDIHGGPTGQTLAACDPAVQYLATRGYAVLAVNYRGSSGYGRRYMLALRGQWGALDVEDATGGARHLVDADLADPGRLVIMGGSAGGYTVLRALTTHPGFFRAGVCCYGISDLLALARDTHRFEARYLDSLLGPLPAAAALYRERSPLFAADRIRDPVAIFQGADDEVVPRAQSDAIAESLRRRGVPHLYTVFEGEGHGWRRPQTIDAYIRAVEAFLREHVLFA
ncbi:MAG: S9 family peptidase [Gemmatimonadota bacterium]